MCVKITCRNEVNVGNGIATGNIFLFPVEQQTAGLPLLPTSLNCGKSLVNIRKDGHLLAIQMVTN